MSGGAWGESRQGLGRGQNQDAVGLNPDDALYVVSDGMGGHAEGARASAEVVSGVLEPARDGGTRAQGKHRRLYRRVLSAHRRVADLAQNLDHAGDMGATVVALWLEGESYSLAAVGDSRAYLWRGGELAQVNEDHTLVHRLVAKGVIGQAEVESHPQRHVLTQAMGVGEVEPDLFQGQAAVGDRFLLTSDGVHGVLDDAELARLLGEAATPQAAVEAILDSVARHEGQDDATALAVFV